MAIQSVTLTNFRGFRHHTAAFADLSVFVGLNNAGKSTLIDAMRLLAVAAQKSLTAKFVQAPAWLRHKERGVGFSTTFNTVDFEFSNLGYNNERDEITQLVAKFRNRATLTIWLDPDSQANFVQVRNRSNEVATNRAEAKSASLTPIYIMPPIQRVLSNEVALNPETVRNSSYGRLAYRHFRNQLANDRANFRDWTELLEATWPKLRVVALDRNMGEGENELHLTIADPPFVSELAAVGSGLQSWMQLVWFLCRTPKDSSIILDEPDAYLHADLQRKLVKIIADMSFEQVSIATHSTEIISDVDPSAIIVVKKRNRHSQKAIKSGGVQKVVDGLGSRHNVQLSKLSEAKKVLIYEGDDQKFLAQIALKLGGNSYNRFMMVPYFDIAGVQNWHEAVGAAKALAAATSNHVSAHLIIDRDYRSAEEVAEIGEIAAKSKLQFHCWSRKEIENYFVEPKIIAKYVTWRTKDLMSVETAQKLISECANDLVDYTLQTIDFEYFKGSDSDAARAHFSSLSEGRKLEYVVGGKRLLSKISGRLQKEWGCQLNATNICRFVDLADLDDEMVSLVRRLSALR